MKTIHDESGVAVGANQQTADVQAEIEWLEGECRGFNTSDLEARYRNILAYIKHLERQQQWHPIETAPKDATDILVAGGKVLWEDGDVHDVDAETVNQTFWHRGKWHGGDEKSLNQSYWYEPTHWMPLPAAPQEVA